MLIIRRIQKGTNQLLVVDENAELQKYFAEWTKAKKLFRSIILWSLWPLMVALVISNQKVAFCSFYIMPFQNACWYCIQYLKFSICFPSHLCSFLSSLKSPITSTFFFITHLYFHIFEWLPKTVVELLGLPVCCCLISRWKSFFLWFTCQDLSSDDNNFNVLSASFYFIMLPLALEGSANLANPQNANGNRIATAETFGSKGMRGKGARFQFY